MSKKFVVNPTPQQRILMKKYWDKLQQLEEDFFQGVSQLEEEMQIEIGIEDLEFYQSDAGGFCGIGNVSRTMNLIHEFELKKSEELN